MPIGQFNYFLLLQSIIQNHSPPISRLANADYFLMGLLCLKLNLEKLNYFLYLSNFSYKL